MKRSKLGRAREWKTFELNKCPLCNKGKLRPVREAMPVDGVEYEALQCIRCGESIMTMGQLDVLADKYRKLRRAKEITFSKWGNSLAMRIPCEIATEYHLSIGSQGLLVKEKKGIKIILRR